MTAAFTVTFAFTPVTQRAHTRASTYISDNENQLTAPGIHVTRTGLENIVGQARVFAVGFGYLELRALEAGESLVPTEQAPLLYRRLEGSHGQDVGY